MGGEQFVLSVSNLSQTTVNSRESLKNTKFQPLGFTGETGNDSVFMLRSVNIPGFFVRALF